MSTPKTVGPDERISRFVLERNKFKPSAGTLKYNAFLPPKSGKTSVYRTSSLDEIGIWKIGKNDVLDRLTGPDKDRKKLLGRGDIPAAAIFEQGLMVASAPEPHPLHANITDWPEEKSDRNDLAKQLARKSKLILYPNP